MSRSDQFFEVNSWVDDKTSLRRQVSVLQVDRQAKFVVIGAGFSGLAAARRLASEFPDEQILLVESQTVGAGSSSRSSGFVVSLGQFERLSSPENRRFYEFGKSALDSLRTLVEQYGIRCDWLEQGRVVTARSRSGAGSLLKMERVLSKLDSPFVKMTGEEVKDQTGMSGYVSGIRQVESVLVNPAKLIYGLVDALPENVEVFQGSPVVSLKKLDGGRTRLELANCVVESEKVLITSNVFSLNLGFGFNRVFPMRTFVSVARVVSGNGLGEDPHWGLTSSERVGSSLRRVGDRVFIRNCAFYGFDSHANRNDKLDRISAFQRASIQRRFPDCEIVVENTWSGVIGITANGGQIFGQVDDGIYLSTGYNGHGIAQGTKSGELLADLSVSKDSQELSEMLKVKKPIWIPTGSSLRRGVAAYCRYLEWRYRDEI